MMRPEEVRDEIAEYPNGSDKVHVGVWDGELDFGMKQFDVA